MEEKKLNVHQKLLEVRKGIDYLKKENKNPNQKYLFVSSSQVLIAIRKMLDEYGLMIIPRIIDKEIKILGDEGKALIFTELIITYEVRNVDNPKDDYISIPFYGQGIDFKGEKGVGKALTYAEKYFFLKLFNIPTDIDDPDFGGKENKAEKAPVKKKEPVYLKAVSSCIKKLEECYDPPQANKFFQSFKKRHIGMVDIKEVSEKKLKELYEFVSVHIKIEKYLTELKFTSQEKNEVVVEVIKKVFPKLNHANYLKLSFEETNKVYEELKQRSEYLNNDSK